MILTLPQSEFALPPQHVDPITGHRMNLWLSPQQLHLLAFTLCPHFAIAVWEDCHGENPRLAGAALSTGAVLPLTDIKHQLVHAKNNPNKHVIFQANHFTIVKAPRNYCIHLENALAAANEQLRSTPTNTRGPAVRV